MLCRRNATIGLKKKKEDRICVLIDEPQNSLKRDAIESLLKSGAMDSIGPSRRGMLMVLAQAMAHGKKTRSDSDRGQGSIFDLLMEAEPADDKAGKNGKFRFNLKASNGQVILSSEAYDSRKGAESGLLKFHPRTVW